MSYIFSENVLYFARKYRTFFAGMKQQAEKHGFRLAFLLLKYVS